MRRTLLPLILGATTLTCSKVPLTRVDAAFSLAQSVWFEDEQTLFLFYRVSADQGLSPDSRVEIRYDTDDGAVDWTPVERVVNVHEHKAVACAGRCGSLSPWVKKEPRNVTMRLRYHRDGSMAKEHVPQNFVLRSGAPQSHRSFVVYGVFDGANAVVEWRGRHQFPALRNQEAEDLGLRRTFRIENQSYGTQVPGFDANNLYLYAKTGESCPEDFTRADFPVLWARSVRAVRNREPLPPGAVTASAACARSVVTDATGERPFSAFARKNPEVRPAFDLLRSPIRANRQVRFLLAPCRRTISGTHLAMQRQRLSLADTPDVCTDEADSPTFSSALAAQIQSRIDEERREGSDMVLSMALHHDDDSETLATAVEEALAAVLPGERGKASPRATGAFVFDSVSRAMKNPAIKSLVLWCPAFLPRDARGQPIGTPDVSQMSCPILPDTNLKLGPFRFSMLPILPTRAQYLDFLKTYSEAQAGRVQSLSFLAPERSAVSTDIAFGDFGWATFFNNERITVAEGESFGYCPDADAVRFVLRSDASPEVPVPLSSLPALHLAAPQDNYELGLVWEFPFLMKLQYQTSIAGAVSAFSATVPFGMKRTGSQSYGSDAWTKGEFPLGEALVQCKRFCDHPAFDSAGVYNAAEPWKQAHLTRCYRPRYPAPGGFPHDP